MFTDRNVVLGVTGSISVYKAVDLASRMVKDGITVDVVMTQSATKFVTPLSFRSIVHRPVLTDMWAPITDFNIEHVALAERADVMVIAPATANTIAKLANGLADDLLSCTVLSTRAPIILAPAMDLGMYQNEITQQNLDRLRSRGFTIVGPGSGRLASGLVGPGRLTEVAEIQAEVYRKLGQIGGDLSGKKVVVSAGGTQEPIDAVRYIGNYSSGKMGCAIAEAARNRGADVTLVAGSVSVLDIYGITTIKVGSAAQMRDAVLSQSVGADVLIMAAAVADYRPETTSKEKIKRKADKLSLELVKTSDILGEVSGVPVKVGFAAESSDVAKNAEGKLKAKGLDFIVANDITGSDCGFSVDTNRVTIIDADGSSEELPLMLKSELADRILDRVVSKLTQKA